MNKPQPKDYGWIDSNPALGEEGGWTVEGGEEAYEEAVLAYYDSLKIVNVDIESIPDFDFDTWFDLFKDCCRSLGFNGIIDKYTFEDNWELGDEPEKVAKDFVAEMNS